MLYLSSMNSPFHGESDSGLRLALGMDEANSRQTFSPSLVGRAGLHFYL